MTKKEKHFVGGELAVLNVFKQRISAQSLALDIT